MKPISKLHYITTSAALTEKACMGGVDWIQLRLKNISYADYYTVAKEVQAICRDFGATFIINDNVALAMDVDADGVHIGKQDMAPDVTRTLIGERFIIGATANTVEDIIKLSSMPVNYIGLGPFRFTNTKQNLSPVIGIDGYKKIFTELTEKNVQYPPLVGIGGIMVNDMNELMTTGLYGVAVSGAITDHPDVTGAAIAFKRFLN